LGISKVNYSESFYQILKSFQIAIKDPDYQSLNPFREFAICDLSPNQDIKSKSGAKIVDTTIGKTIFEMGNYASVSLNSVLTKRETEILALIAKGFLSKQIADKLKISINTVNNHRRNILEKTGCSNTFEALKYLFSK